jgi:hypothetical protein
MKRTAVTATALAALACASSVAAHHSISMFDIGKPVWVKGTVVRFEPVNPHIVFALDETTVDGQARRWTIEGSGLNSFNRRGLSRDFLAAGDLIEVCGFAVKDEVARQRSDANPGNLSRPDIHGHVLIMPDGQMQIFGGYGKTENCIRPTDEVSTWVDFLNGNRMARDVWCMRRFGATFPSVAPPGFVAEVDRSMTNPCTE